MIRAVIFDCFGVLYVPKSDYIYQSLLANPPKHHDEIRDLVAQNEYGLIDDEALFEGISHLTNVPLDQVRRNLVGGFVRNHQLVNYIEHTLRPHYKVAILTNLGRNSVVKYFSEAERTKLFDAVVISGEVGMIKPHPEIYEYTCRQLGVDTSEALFIDDIESNCEGARLAGLSALRYDSLPHLMTELERTLKVQ